MRPNVRTTLIAAVALVLGALIGWFAGRWSLERAWSQPVRVLSARDAQQNAADGADPTPSAGARVFIPMPLARTREAGRTYTAGDPLVLTVGSVGRNGIKELNLVFKNRSACTVTAFQAVAYGFDAYGTPRPMNRHGEHFVAVNARDVHIAPGETALVEQELHYATNASLAFAHVESASCDDGTRWARN
jgi:hypothetical protein